MQAVVSADEWTYPYPREKAAYPVAGLRDMKYWATTSRVDNVYGDRHVVPTLEKESGEQSGGEKMAMVG